MKEKTTGVSSDWLVAQDIDIKQRHAAKHCFTVVLPPRKMFPDASPRWSAAQLVRQAVWALPI